MFIENDSSKTIAAETISDTEITEQDSGSRFIIYEVESLDSDAREENFQNKKSDEMVIQERKENFQNESELVDLDEMVVLTDDEFKEMKETQVDNECSTVNNSITTAATKMETLEYFEIVHFDENEETRDERDNGGETKEPRKERNRPSIEETETGKTHFDNAIEIDKGKRQPNSAKDSEVKEKEGGVRPDQSEDMVGSRPCTDEFQPIYDSQLEEYLYYNEESSMKEEMENDESEGLNRVGQKITIHHFGVNRLMDNDFFQHCFIIHDPWNAYVKSSRVFAKLR